MTDINTLSKAVIKALAEHPLADTEWECYTWNHQDNAQYSASADEVIEGLRNGKAHITIWVNKDD